MRVVDEIPQARSQGKYDYHELDRSQCGGELMPNKKWDKKDQQLNILYYGVGGQWDVIYKPTGETIGVTRAMRHRKLWRGYHITGEMVSPLAFHSRRSAAVRLRREHEETIQKRGGQ